MLEHQNELEPTLNEINTMNKLMNCSPKEEAEGLIKEFKELGLSDTLALTCAMKVCRIALENTLNNYFRRGHWESVREILLYEPIGITEKLW